MNVLAIDQGTSATKALLIGPGDEILGRAEVPVTVRSTADGGAETDPGELLGSVLAAGSKALATAGAAADAVALAWAFPNALRIPGPPPPRGRFLLRTAEFGPAGWFEIRQDARVLARVRHGRLVPGRSAQLTGAWVAGAGPAPPIRIALA